MTKSKLKILNSKHNVIIIAVLSVIPACLESFLKEGCPETSSGHDRELM